MSIPTTEILVIDLEATCWENKKPEGQKNEVIEIGICVIDIETHSIIRNETIIVTPTTSEISEFCTQLTSITPELIKEQGISFYEACRKLELIYNSKNAVFASYGAYDKNQMLQQCKDENVSYPFADNHINVKQLFALHKKMRKQVGMKAALDILNLKLEGTHHRGVDDAKNIAGILLKILK